VYVDHFGEAAFVARCRTVCQRNTGATLSPFNGFLFLQGIQTLALRMERHVENARKVAEFLRAHPMVNWVNYAGFPDSPLYPIAHRYLGSNFCSLLTFGVKGGYEGGIRCFDSFRLFKRMVNMGDAKSLSCHPASTTSTISSKIWVKHWRARKTSARGNVFCFGRARLVSGRGLRCD
ncbi:MAG: PLP-dependent transferase, partial [Terriglobales bacterium]